MAKLRHKSDLSKLTQHGVEHQDLNSDSVVPESVLVITASHGILLVDRKHLHCSSHFTILTRRGEKEEDKEFGALFLVPCRSSCLHFSRVIPAEFTIERWEESSGKFYGAQRSKLSTERLHLEMTFLNIFGGEGICLEE